MNDIVKNDFWISKGTVVTGEVGKSISC